MWGVEDVRVPSFEVSIGGYSSVGTRIGTSTRWGLSNLHPCPDVSGFLTQNRGKPVPLDPGVKDVHTKSSPGPNRGPPV